MKFLNRIIYISLFLISYFQGISQPDFVRYLNHSWVDSCLQSMTLDEKIGQLFILDAYANKGASEYNELFEKLDKYHPGGIIFMKGEVDKQVRLTNMLQLKSKIPLLISMDAEWGPGFRLENTPKYPVQMALGAITEDSLIYQMGIEIGEQLKRIGVSVNFAPVADVNNNPANPVINFRSFGENPDNVARKSWLYAKGLQDVGILPVAKHFPGHGDTQTDSHLGLPVINHSIAHLDSIELKPFTYLINKGIGGIMTAHLHVEAFDPEKKIPASLSNTLISKKLIDDLGFGGLVITDAMNMHGVSKLYTPGEAAVRALLAGNDVLEMLPDVDAAFNSIKTAVEKGIISETIIDWKCRKILAAKKWLQLDQSKPILLENLHDDLNNSSYELTKRLLHEQSLTLIKNNNNILPLQNLDTLKVATVSVGRSSQSTFQNMIGNYQAVDHYLLKEDATSDDVKKLRAQLENYNLIICGIHNLNLSPKSQFGTDESIDNFLSQLKDKKKIIALLGNPYALKYIAEAFNSEALLVTYQENTITQELSAEAIYGAINVNGKLSVTVNDEFHSGYGLSIKKNNRLKYTIPEEVGINSKILQTKIDSLAELGIAEKAYPGCQILIAKDGKVIFHKTYGYHTYDQKHPVLKDNIYDWASLTKITGPLPALMKLYGDKKFKLDVPFQFYWPDFNGSNKAHITAREILAHQARLQAWIPYWTNTLKKNGKLRKSVFKDHPTNRFDLRVSSNLYMNSSYLENMYADIRDSELLPTNKYKYSGLAFYLFPKIIENLTERKYEEYLKDEFYKPLGANTITYNAYKHFPPEIIIPTENDEFFRHELLKGFVHDEGASMMGGISGNAGLFGTANDLAKLMQMYLQGGNYGGRSFIEKEAIDEFTRIQYPKNENRRGLGFDKPYIDNYKNQLKDAYPAVSSSTKSFGHSGYTGTFTWADPKNNLLFIFFSNRVYPTRENSKLFDLNLRPQMHQAIYDCLQK
ncbi:glycoside hydrolase family 3 N-terminal domain-containing protein [Sunxiuqinia sp. A32]|uniref:glycoside hydrolase family 3 N-terminal domain-containing protein n=1 Tax=Sunxiuqinia sp. A32 TaxID=3461496 RepID=UPI0040465AA2